MSGFWLLVPGAAHRVPAVRREGVGGSCIDCSDAPIVVNSYLCWVLPGQPAPVLVGEGVIATESSFDAGKGARPGVEVSGGGVEGESELLSRWA